MFRTLHPDARHVAAFDRVLQVDIDHGLARRGLAAGVVERVELLELLLDPVGDLESGFLDGGAGPLGRDHHRLDGEGRILLAPQVDVGEDAGDGRTRS